MINRRGFLQLLGALGAAVAMPLDALLAAPADPIADEPIAEDAGEGFWWTPRGGKPIRLEVLRWEIAVEGPPPRLRQDLVGRDWDFIYEGPSQTTVRIEFRSDPILRHEEQHGSLKATLKQSGGNQFEWPDCFVTQSSIEHHGGKKLTQSMEVIAGEVLMAAA